MRLNRVAVLMLLLTACDGEYEVLDLHLPASEGTAILALGATETIYAFTLGKSFLIPRTFAEAQTQQLELLIYDATLAELGLVEGELTPSASGEKLEAADQIFTTNFTPHAAISWSPRAEPSTALAALALEFRKISAIDCAAAGRCFLTETSRSCRTCPELSSDPEPPEPPQPPAAARAPQLTPCPEGWTTHPATREEPARCEPWPSGQRDTCPPGQAMLPSAGGCTPLGTPCPIGQWPNDQPPGTRYYVDPGAPAGGDGTIDRPFDTVTRALAAGSSTIILSKGDHLLAATTLSSTITLLGACAAETKLLATSAPDPLFTVTSSAVQLRDLTISGAPTAAVVTGSGHLRLEGVLLTALTSTAVIVADGASAHLRRAAIISAAGPGVTTRGGRVTARGVFIDAVADRAFAADAAGAELIVSDFALRAINPADAQRRAYAISVRRGAAALISSGVVEGSEDGIALRDTGSTATITAVLVRDLGPRAIALSAWAGARVSVDDLQVARGSGIAADTATVTLRDVSIQGFDSGTLPAESSLGIGAARATLRGERILVDRVTEGALSLAEGSNARISDFIARDVGPKFEEDVIDAAIRITDTKLLLDHAQIERSTRFGVMLAGETTGAEISDLAVRDTRGDQTLGTSQACLAVIHGAAVKVDRATFELCQFSAIAVETLATPIHPDLRFHDISVLDTRGVAAGEGASPGAGIYFIDFGAFDLHYQISLERVLVRGGPNGLVARHQNLTMHDVRIQSSAYTGLDLIDGCEVTAERISIEDASAYGATLASPGTKLQAGELVISGTRCIERCANGSGAGLTARLTAQAFISRFVIKNNERAGVHLIAGTAALADGVIAGHPIGALNETVALDSRHLLTRVSYEANAEAIVDPIE